MAYFGTVGDVIAQARVILQDTDVAQYRYDTASVFQAMNEAILESARLRPDFFRGGSIPQYAPGNEAVALGYPQTYVPALVNFICGRVQIRDDEQTEDSRAAVFLNTFAAKLTQAVS